MVDYAKNNMSGSLSTYSTISRWPADATVVEPLVASLEKAFPDSEVTKRVKEKFEVIKSTSVGSKAPDIQMRDGDGKMLSLYESKGNKVTLIDFWGSWCGPCRREAGTLSDLYLKNKDKGFQIFGVGLEEEMQLWRAAKEKDKRIWPNVLSLKQFDTEAAFDYGITSLPANFLIDAEGKIVARDLHDEVLVAKVEELLGE